MELPISNVGGASKPEMSSVEALKGLASRIDGVVKWEMLIFQVMYFHFQGSPKRSRWEAWRSG